MSRIRALTLGILVVLATVAVRFDAAAATYKIAGSFENGLITGSFDFDDDGAISNIAFVTTGDIEETYDAFGSYAPAPDGAGYTGFFYFYGPTFDLIMSAFIESPFDIASVTWDVTQYRPEGGTRYGSATLSPVGVVPVPAALPLAASAMAGLGGIGWLKRRRGMTAAA